MQVLKKLFRFYVESNLHVGLAGASFTLITLFNYSEINKIIFSGFVFFSTVLSYQFIRIFENCECTYKSVLFFINKQTVAIKALIAIAVVGMIYFGWLIGISKLWILFPAVLLTFWYAIPVLKKNNKRISLRNYPNLKLFSIALVWSIVTVLFPLQEQIVEIYVWLLFIQRFILILVLVIPFDIRDMYSDTPDLATLPQQIGVGNSIKVGMLLLIMFVIVSFFRFPIDEVIVLSDIFVFVITLLFLLKTTPNQSKYYASFWVESIPILWLLFLWGMKTIIR
jgi:hypothetical protein